MISTKGVGHILGMQMMFSKYIIIKATVFCELLILEIQIKNYTASYKTNSSISKMCSIRGNCVIINKTKKSETLKKSNFFEMIIIFSAIIMKILILKNGTLSTTNIPY